MGTIYKRDQTYWLKYYRNGKPYYESTGSQKETDARKLLKKNDADLREAAHKQEAYLQSQMVTKTVTIGNFGTKEESSDNA